MTLSITKKIEEPLLDKVRIEAIWSGEKKQTKSEIAKDIAKHLSIGEELVTIEHVYPKFGDENVRVLASGYKRPETKSFFKKKEKKAPVAPSGG